MIRAKRFKTTTGKTQNLLGRFDHTAVEDEAILRKRLKSFKSLTEAKRQIVSANHNLKIVLDRMDNNILLYGRDNVMTGSFWAPGGMLELFTTASQMTGKVVARKIRLAGCGNVFNDGTR